MDKVVRFDLRRHFPGALLALIALLLIVAAGAIYIYLGAYNIGADAPHSKFVYSTLETLRERAIAAHSRDIRVPADLDDPKRTAAGAGLYDEMCTGCHLGPGIEKSEMSQGLYPPAPELALGRNRTPEQQFWIIKHGVKLTAMPTWGKTHDDRLIWDMVAFIRQLPKMSPAQYKAAVASAPGSHEEMMEGHADEAPAKAVPHEPADGHAHKHGR